MTEPIAPGGVDPAEAVVYPDPTSLESLQRRAGHCAGRPCVPRCGYCGSFRQCERCEAITAQLRAERERDEARAEVERLRRDKRAHENVIIANGEWIGGVCAALDVSVEIEPPDVVARIRALLADMERLTAQRREALRLVADVETALALDTIEEWASDIRRALGVETDA